MHRVQPVRTKRNEDLCPKRYDSNVTSEILIQTFTFHLTGVLYKRALQNFRSARSTRNRTCVGVERIDGRNARSFSDRGTTWRGVNAIRIPGLMSPVSTFPRNHAKKDTLLSVSSYFPPHFPRLTVEITLPFFRTNIYLWLPFHDQKSLTREIA